MQVLERKHRDVIEGVQSHSSGSSLSSLEQSSEPNVLRRMCLWLSNLILQFPLMFELQQKSLSQPTLLRREVERDLYEYANHGSSDYLVLDYGCGSGTYSGLCKPVNYLGIDCNKGMLERASAVNPDHSFVHATNLDGIGTTLNSVVHILMVGVIHHLSADDLIEILSAIPRDKEVKILAIDTLKSTNMLGRAVQLFERGEYLRSEEEHLNLLSAVATQTSYKRVPYGQLFELAVYRGTLK